MLAVTMPPHHRTYVLFFQKVLRMTFVRGGEITDDMAAPQSIGRYTATEVGRLAGVSARRIGQWARYGLIPSVSRHPRVYSYADAGEAVLVRYLVEQQLRPRDVREIVQNLHQEFGDWPLATAPLLHDGKFVVIRRGDRLYFAAQQAEQEVIPEALFDLHEIRGALSRGGWVALKTPRDHIEVNPNRLSGAPAVRGHRVLTSTVANLAARPEGLRLLKDDFDLSDAEIADAVNYENDVSKALAA